MPPAQTQSLPTWAFIQALPSVTKPFDDEDPLYLSGEETDCDSERDSDTISREDQQLLSSYMCLQNEQATKKLGYHRVVPRSGTRTTPLSIPAQTHKYIATSSKRWIWDEDHDDGQDQCSCCSYQSTQHRSATYPPTAERRGVFAVSDLMFDLEL